MKEKNMEDKQKLIENATTEELEEALEYMKGKPIINLIYSDKRESLKKELKKRRRLKRLTLFYYCVNCDEWDIDLTCSYCSQCGSGKLELMTELPTEELIEHGWLQEGDRD